MSDIKKSVVIAEDSTLMREALRRLISSAPNFHVVAEAEDGKEAIELVAKLKPNLVLIDLSMPRMNGTDAIREIRRRTTETKIVVITVHKTEEYIFEALNAGADGYIVKEASHAELMMALNTVLDGRRYISPGISHKVMEGYLDARKTLKAKSSWENLTRREREILRLIAEGYRNREIADYLSVSIKTIEKHRANLMQKLDLHNVQAITAFAIEKGLVSTD